MKTTAQTPENKTGLTRRMFLQGSMILPLFYFLPEVTMAEEVNPHHSFASTGELYLNRIRSHSSPILQALQAGMAAPSSHNVQPWSFEIIDDRTALLFLDPARLLPHTDPPGRQVMISQGTFLEMAKIGGTMAGLRVTHTIFPEGMGADLFSGQRPIARIVADFDSSVREEDLAEHIPKRLTDRREYENHPLPMIARTGLIEEAQRFSSRLDIIQDSTDVRKIRELAEQGMRIESDTFHTNEESRIWFRVTDDEIYEHRDGVSLRGNGISGLRLFVAKNFFISGDPESFHSRSNRDAGVNLLKQALESTATFLTLTTETNTMRDQLMAGRDYLRLQLRATGHGIHLQPISQILQEYPEMNGPREEYERLSGTSKKGKVQMLLRAGVGTEEFHSPRRSLVHLIRGE